LSASRKHPGLALTGEMGGLAWARIFGTPHHQPRKAVRDRGHSKRYLRGPAGRSRMALIRHGSDHLWSRDAL